MRNSVEIAEADLDQAVQNAGLPEAELMIVPADSEEGRALSRAARPRGGGRCPVGKMFGTRFDAVLNQIKK